MRRLSRICSDRSKVGSGLDAACASRCPQVLGAHRTTFTHWTKSSEMRVSRGPAGVAHGLKAILRGAASADKGSRPPRRIDPPMGCD